ncbi:unnamed protein product [Vitrella brassicaformis CCMP3155]|uniref:UBC core domain-containing protein n=1 Tax=Vitrella brassicaformis (strain CCMP3155) TaxID=1169540 RepID=A0A0G4GQN8_VITBC|nr:unnamed protein product [Vitrella brassicaformis CCMP3155]|eukprot:CEM32784.1 unnamed protein product [Vitrella brassicaformis CCMP3155]
MLVTAFCSLIALACGLQTEDRSSRLLNAAALRVANVPSSAAKRRSSVRGAAKDHLRRSFRPGHVNYRIQKELKDFLTTPPDHCEIAVGSNIRVWIITLTGVEGTLYEGEKYRLKIVFPPEYPLKPPIIYFLQPTPRHPHVYSNGDICLNLLGTDWKPTLTVASVALSILSMLSSAKEKKLPLDNASHADLKAGGQQHNWMYHDDKC